MAGTRQYGGYEASQYNPATGQKYPSFGGPSKVDYSSGGPPVGSLTAAGSMLGPVGTGIGAGADLLNLVMQGYGLYKQDKDNKAQRALSTQWRGEDIERSDEAIARAEKASARQWKWMEEERSYQRKQNWNNNFMNMIDRKQGFKNNLLNIWRR